MGEQGKRESGEREIERERAFRPKNFLWDKASTFIKHKSGGTGRENKTKCCWITKFLNLARRFPIFHYSIHFFWLPSSSFFFLSPALGTNLPSATISRTAKWWLLSRIDPCCLWPLYWVKNHPFWAPKLNL